MISQFRSQAYIVSLLLFFIALAVSHREIRSASAARFDQRTLQISDQEALRKLAEQFYDSVQQRDLTAFSALWSKNSLQREGAINIILEERKSGRSSPIKNFSVRSVALANSVVRVVFQQDQFDDATNRVNGVTDAYQSLICIKENGVWKVSRCVPTIYEIALNVMSAAEADRMAFLEKEKGYLPPDWRKDCQNNGFYALRSGDYQTARLMFSFMKILSERLGDKIGIAMALNFQSQMANSQGSYQEAIQMMDAGIKLLQEDNSEEALLAKGTLTTGLGDLYLFQNILTRSLKMYRQGAEIFNRMTTEDGRRGRAAILAGLGQIYFRMDVARFETKDCEELLKKRQDRNSIETAGKLFNQSLEISKSVHYSTHNQVTALAGLGDVYASEKKYNLAADNYNQALRLNSDEYYGSRERDPGLLSNLAHSYLMQGRYQEALQKSQEAEKLARQFQNRYSGRFAFTWMGKAYRALGQIEQAKEALRRAISLIEAEGANVGGSEVNQIAYFSNKFSSYLELIDLLVSDNKPLEALFYAELSKARMLSLILQNGRPSIDEKLISQADRDREKSINSRIVEAIARCQKATSPEVRTACQKEEEQALADYVYFRDVLFNKYPALSASYGKIRPADFNEIGKVMTDPRTAIVQFVTEPERTIVFVISKREQSAAPIVIAKTIEIPEDRLNMESNNFRNLIEKFDDLDEKNKRANKLELSSKSKELYQLLLAPVEEHISGKRQLVIIPDNALWQIPFQALLKSSDKKIETYLIEHFAISYAPSLTAWRLLSNSRDSKGAIDYNNKILLAVGNPSPLPSPPASDDQPCATRRYGPIEATAFGVRDLEKIVGRDRSRILIGRDATEEQVKKEAHQYRFLHFASHGEFLDSSAITSHLVLAPGEVDDGRLTGIEILKLNLQAEMVTLAACKTGQGNYSYGEGLTGMTWAFFIAGTPTTVAAIWDIKDKDSRKLMTAFYKHLLQNPSRPEISKAAALQDAIIELLKAPETQHPYYWAGFNIIGKD